MTAIAPKTGERIEATPRKRLTQAQKRKLLDTQDGLCGNCQQPLFQEIEGQRLWKPMIDEHVERLFVGGSNDLANRQMWCVDCAREKTRAEAKPNAKIRRLIIKEDPDQRKPSRMQSRGFDKTKSRGFDGKVRAR